MSLPRRAGEDGAARHESAPAAPSGRREPHGSPHCEIVAIASSAGGIGALTRVLGALSATFPVPVVIVQHLDPHHPTVLAEVLGRRTRLRVQLAEADDVVRPGVVYIAPPNHHLLIGAGGTMTLSDTEAVHFVRPSADLLFKSIADAYGPTAVACVLSGSGRDGATGIEAVKARGGTVIAEDPDTAEFGGMPSAATATGAVDLVLPLDEIAGVLTTLVCGKESP